MQEYRVVECQADEGRVALQCGSGQYHLARTLNAVPAVGAQLHGAHPRLGFGILVCPGSGSVYRVIFEKVNATDVRRDGSLGAEDALEAPSG